MMQENKSEESIAISVTIVLALSMFTRIRQRCEFDVQTPRNTKLKSESLTSIWDLGGHLLVIYVIYLEFTWNTYMHIYTH